MNAGPDIRAALDDAAGLLGEIARRDKVIDALVYQVERNQSDPDHDYGLLHTTFVLEEQVRQRTEELSATLNTLSKVSAAATAERTRLEAAVENISDGFALFDPDGRVLLCNEAFRHLWDLSGAVTGRTLGELLAKGGGATPPSAVLAQLEACRAGQGRAELQLPDGQSLRVRERRMADGCVVGIYSDVTELRAEEARLRRQELAHKSRRLQSTLDTIDQGIAVFDASPALVAWNPRFFALLDLAPGLARPGTTPQELADADDNFIFRLCSTTATDGGPTRHREYVLPGGAILDVACFPMPDGGFVFTASDITARKQGEERIRSLLGQQRAIFDNAHVGILFLRERRIMDANSRMAEMFGYDGPQALVGQTTELLFPTRTEFVATGSKVYSELTRLGYSEGTLRMRRRDGTLMWMRVSGRPLDPQAPQEGSIWVYSDVTRDHEQRAQLELAQLVFNHSNEALMVSDADNLIRSVNKAFTTFTGYTEAEAIGQSPSLLKSGQHDEEFYRRMWATLLAEDRWEGEVIDRHKSGRLYPKWLSIRVVRHPNGRVAHFVAAFSDISARKAAEEKIQFMAHHDALTGLPNRVLLQDRFEQTFRHAGREHQALALFFLDLDHFKRVNDSFGHAAGDDLLMAIAQRLKGCLRASDTVSRLGGDEFILLVECSDSPRYAVAVAEKIRQALDAPVEVKGQMLSVSGTLGIAMAPTDGEDFGTLMKKADTAMYHAKAAGRGSYSFFDERMNRDTAHRLVLTTALRHALERNEMQMVYQPQFDLLSGRVTGVEALMRWHSERFGKVSPRQFIPLAEETSLIASIGEWALFEACRQVRAWSDAGFSLKVAVNVSPMQVHRDDFTNTLAAVLRDTGAAAAQLELELTESTLMTDAPRFVEAISYLRALGISVAIDDFGTGYSSLAYLKRFQVSKLKVDRSFVRDIPGDEDDCAIAEAIVRMGQTLRLRVNAEGVETHAQFDFLSGIGCHEVQGFLLARPLPAAALEALLAQPHPLREALACQPAGPAPTPEHT
jgi:diguanylate cyclase (GGDEF)-like protein/PAS domain S-box-containing protein